MQCQVQIVLNDTSKRLSRAVKDALGPDNVNIPDGLSIDMSSRDDKIIFNFESVGNMGHLTSTVDEVLEHIGIALKVIGDA